MEGNVYIDNVSTREMPLNYISRQVGIVLQDPGIQIMMPTVEDELAFGLENRGTPRELIRERLNDAMELTGITGLKVENPVHLSGGQKQLVAIASVLVLAPPVIVFDEALSMLDQSARERIVSLMEKLRQIDKTLIIVDHTSMALKLCDEILVLEEGKNILHGPRDYILAQTRLLAQHNIYL